MDAGKKGRVIAVVGAGGKTTLVYRMAKQLRDDGFKVLLTTTTHMYREKDALVFPKEEAEEKSTEEQRDEEQRIEERRLAVRSSQEAKSQGKLSQETKPWKNCLEELNKRLTQDGSCLAGSPCPKDPEKIESLPTEIFARSLQLADYILIEADGAKHHDAKYPSDTEPVIPSETDEVIIVMGLAAIGKPAGQVIFRYGEMAKYLPVRPEDIVTFSLLKQIVDTAYEFKIKKQAPKAKVKRYYTEKTENGLHYLKEEEAFIRYEK